MERQNVKPIPPTYQGKAWSAKLLQSLSTSELKKVIALYGLTAINAKVAINAQRGVK